MQKIVILDLALYWHFASKHKQETRSKSIYVATLTEQVYLGYSNI